MVADSTPSVVENMASLARIHCENYPSFGSPWGIWCNLCLKEDRGERSTDEAENRNHGAVVQKRSVLVWKLTSRFRYGGLRLVRFVLQSSSIYSPFFLARFRVREHWNEHVRVKRLCMLVLVIILPACLFAFCMFIWDRLELCGCTYGDTERAFEVYTDC